MSVDRSAIETTLRETEKAFANLQGVAAQLLLTRARSLDALGRDSEAQQAYVDLLRLDSRHVDGLTGLATVLLRGGQRTAARSALARAVEVRPDSAAAQANLATLLCESNPDAARAHYEHAVRLDPDNKGAHRGLAVLLLRAGEVERARAHGRVGFGGHVEAWPFRGTGKPVSILWVQSALGGNVPVESLLDDRIFHRLTVAPEFFDPAEGLPAHDLVFNTLGDVDRCGGSLDAVDAAIAKTTAPVINAPAAVRPTGRRENAERLARIPDVVAPRIAQLPRARLASADAAQMLEAEGFRWPLLLRSPGFHTGENFVKVDGPEGLAEAIAALPGEELLAIQFIDTRSTDGFYRKYRAMTIDGRLYPLHLAVGPHWKIHYFSSDMAERADHRAEDEAFLGDMPGVLGARAMRALENVRELLGLDYGGIDFALDGEGRVVIFEANATMVIVAPSDEPQWAYRKAPVLRARHAVVHMLMRRAGRM